MSKKHATVLSISQSENVPENYEDATNLVNSLSVIRIPSTHSIGGPHRRTVRATLKYMCSVVGSLTCFMPRKIDGRASLCGAVLNELRVEFSFTLFCSLKVTFPPQALHRQCVSLTEKESFLI